MPMIKVTADQQAAKDLLAGPAQDLRVLVIGTNQCWGMCGTLAEALTNAANPKAYNVFIVHRDSTINPVDGSIQFPLGFRPWLIHTKGKVK